MVLQDNAFPVKFSQDPFEILVANPDQFRSLVSTALTSLHPRKLWVSEVINWLDNHATTNP